MRNYLRYVFIIFLVADVVVAVNAFGLRLSFYFLTVVVVVVSFIDISWCTWNRTLFATVRTIEQKNTLFIYSFDMNIHFDGVLLSSKERNMYKKKVQFIVTLSFDVTVINYFYGCTHWTTDE